MDETATGSANFFGPERTVRAGDGVRVASAAVHLRPPSIDPGLSAGLWAVGLALFLFFGMLALEVEGATALIVSVVSGFAIFLYVRRYGLDAEA